jgi:phosphoribosylaminoimidazolecarboxamide formyltransferase/IMP cyclohydrolase
VFLEAVIAPGFDGEAKKALAAKPNLRVMDMDTTGIHRVTGFDLKRVMGGVLVQQWDLQGLDRGKCEVMTKRKPTDEDWKGSRWPGRWRSTSSRTPSSSRTPFKPSGSARAR